MNLFYTSVNHFVRILSNGVFNDENFSHSIFVRGVNIFVSRMLIDKRSSNVHDFILGRQSIENTSCEMIWLQTFCSGCVHLILISSPRYTSKTLINHMIITILISIGRYIRKSTPIIIIENPSILKFI